MKNKFKLTVSGAPVSSCVQNQRQPRCVVIQRPRQFFLMKIPLREVSERISRHQNIMSNDLEQIQVVIDIAKQKLVKITKAHKIT